MRCCACKAPRPKQCVKTKGHAEATDSNRRRTAQVFKQNVFQLNIMINKATCITEQAVERWAVGVVENRELVHFVVLDDAHWR